MTLGAKRDARVETSHRSIAGCQEEEDHILKLRISDGLDRVEQTGVTEATFQGHEKTSH